MKHAFVSALFALALSGCGGEASPAEAVADAYASATEAICDCASGINPEGECQTLTQAQRDCIARDVAASTDPTLEAALRCQTEAYRDLEGCIPASCSEDDVETYFACFETYEEAALYCVSLSETLVRLVLENDCGS